jgi:hypothetical protein
METDVRRIGEQRRGLEPYEHRHGDSWVRMDREGQPVLVIESSSTLYYRTSHSCPSCGTRHAARSPA